MFRNGGRCADIRRLSQVNHTRVWWTTSEHDWPLGMNATQPLGTRSLVNATLKRQRMLRKITSSTVRRAPLTQIPVALILLISIGGMAQVRVLESGFDQPINICLTSMQGQNHSWQACCQRAATAKQSTVGRVLLGVDPTLESNLNQVPFNLFLSLNSLCLRSSSQIAQCFRSSKKTVGTEHFFFGVRVRFFVLVWFVSVRFCSFVYVATHGDVPKRLRSLRTT